MSVQTLNQSIIAAFDFDGTITTKDSLLPFLIHSTGYFKTYAKLFCLGSDLINYFFHLISRQEAKERTLKYFFAGKSLKELKMLGETFASSTLLKNMIKPSALNRLRWHQTQGHTCILISASIDIYLDPWSRIMGFDHLICSNVEIGKDHLITGHLLGLNCRGKEKTRRLQELMGPKDHYILYAYGDSCGDSELLKLADYSFYQTFS